MRGDQCTGRVDHAVNTPTPIHTYTHAHTQMWHCSDTQVCSMFPRTVSWADGLCVSTSVPVFRYVYVRVCLTLTVKLILLPNSDWETRGHYRTIQIHMVTQTHTHTYIHTHTFDFFHPVQHERSTYCGLSHFFNLYTNMDWTTRWHCSPILLHSERERAKRQVCILVWVHACVCVCVCLHAFCSAALPASPYFLTDIGACYGALVQA